MADEDRVATFRPCHALVPSRFRGDYRTQRCLDSGAGAAHEHTVFGLRKTGWKSRVPVLSTCCHLVGRREGLMWGVEVGLPARGKCCADQSLTQCYESRIVSV
jgi:hypothetical protein